jgi:GPI mannosyltransferase 2
MGIGHPTLSRVPRGNPVVRRSIEIFIVHQMPGPGQTAKAAACALAIFSPLAAYQMIAYKTFCTGEVTPSWCHNTVPSIYDYVQKKYWNSGFMLYWTPAQLPNIILACPSLAVILAFCKHHMHSVSTALLPRSRHNPVQVHSYGVKDPFLHLGLTPHVIHASVMSGVLIFAAHTQIVLRLAASMPLTYWAGAWLLVEHPRCGRLWVAWCMIWGTVSTILWVAFLPPA